LQDADILEMVLTALDQGKLNKGRALNYKNDKTKQTPLSMVRAHGTHAAACAAHS